MKHRARTLKDAAEVIAPGHRSPSEWASYLNAKWASLAGSAVEGFFQLGDDLQICRKQLDLQGYGKGFEKWGAWCKAKLDFGYNIAMALTALARWKDEQQILGNAQKLLPPDYTTLQKISRLPVETFRALLADGTINPTVKRNDIAKILRSERVHADERRILDLKPIEGKFRTLIFDPAWDYEQQSLAGRANPDYAKQSLEQLLATDVKSLWAEENCHLYVWTTNNFVGEAYKLITHWGFQYRTLITWVKTGAFGLGSYFRNSTEQVLFATLGDVTTRPDAASISTHFESPRGEHSEKPEEFYKIVRAASYPPYGEGNQRQQREGFVNLYEEDK